MILGKSWRTLSNAAKRPREKSWCPESKYLQSPSSAYARWYPGANGWPLTIKALWSAEARWKKRPCSHISLSQESLGEARDRCCPFVNGNCQKKSGMFSRTLTGNRIGTTSMVVRKFANRVCPWSTVKWRIFICFLWTIIHGKYGFDGGVQTILNSLLVSVVSHGCLTTACSQVCCSCGTLRQLFALLCS